MVLVLTLTCSQGFLKAFLPVLSTHFFHHFLLTTTLLESEEDEEWQKKYFHDQIFKCWMSGSIMGPLHYESYSLLIELQCMVKSEVLISQEFLLAFLTASSCLIIFSLSYICCCCCWRYISGCVPGEGRWSPEEVG